MGADSPPSPHAQPRRKGYRFIRKTPLRVVLFILAITRRGSLFGRHYSFVSPSLFGLNLWFWECFPASRLLTPILNGGLRPPCPHAQPRRKGYRFIRKTPLRVVLFILAITRRGSLFGRHYSFVSPSLFGLNLWFWKCFPACLCGSFGVSKPPTFVGEFFR